MTQNTNSTHNIPSFMSVFHSVFFEQMADLESLRETSDNSSYNKIYKEELYKRYQNLLPSYFSLGDTTPYQNSSSLNDRGYNFFDYNYNSNVNTNMTAGDVFEDAGSNSISGEGDPCHLISNDEAESYQNIAFQLELIVQPIFVIIGFGFNTVAINILRR